MRLKCVPQSSFDAGTEVHIGSVIMWLTVAHIGSVIMWGTEVHIGSVIMWLTVAHSGSVIMWLTEQPHQGAGHVTSYTH